VALGVTVIAGTLVLSGAAVETPSIVVAGTAVASAIAV
jgi:hypothetical protein